MNDKPSGWTAPQHLRDSVSTAAKIVKFLWLSTSAAYLICYPTGFRAQ